MEITKIFYDHRTIESIHTMPLMKGSDGWGGDGCILQHEVGRDGVISIEAYQEHGQGGYVPWFIIRKIGGDVRVNAAFVAEVEYAQ